MSSIYDKITRLENENIELKHKITTIQREMKEYCDQLYNKLAQNAKENYCFECNQLLNNKSIKCNYEDWGDREDGCESRLCETCFKKHKKPIVCKVCRKWFCNSCDTKYEFCCIKH